MIQRLAFVLAVALVTPLLGFAGNGRAQSSAPTEKQDRAALESRLKALQSALASDVCQDPATARALLAGQAVSAIPPLPSGGKQTALEKADLAKLLKASVVLIVAGSNSGTGFAVAPNLVMTNNHVIAEAPREQILIAGPALDGPPRIGVVAARIEEPGPTGQDFALLRIDGPPLATILPLSPIVGELQSIVAAGFPGLLMGNDIQFHRLMRGDLSAMPELILSQGAVMAIQNRSAKAPSIAHNAQISGGNSGGPLVDACGRIVGINTYIRVASDQGANAGYALGSEAVIRFLVSQGETPRQQGGSCG